MRPASQRRLSRANDSWATARRPVCIARCTLALQISRHAGGGIVRGVGPLVSPARRRGWRAG